MRFITRDTDYALRALIFMALANKKIVTVDEIAFKEGLPKIFLRRIFQRLAKKKVLVSQKGKSGGFSFLKAPSKINLADIVIIFQGKLDMANCLLRRRVCPRTKTCALRNKIRKISGIVNDEFRKITIASLIKGANNG